MISTLVAKSIANLDDVFFFKQPGGSILELTDLENGLLGSSTSHRNGLLSIIHGAHGSSSHRTSLSHAHFLAICGFFLSDCDLKLLFGNSDTLWTEAIVDRKVLDNWTVESEQIKSAR